MTHEVALKLLTGALVIRKLDRGWRIHFFPHSPHRQAPLPHQLLAGLSVPHNVALSIGCLSILTTWQLAYPRVREPGRKRVQDESHRVVFLNNLSVEVIYQHCCCMQLSTWINPAAAKSLQSCPTLCDPIDSSPPGSPVPEILQARTLEWVAMSFSNAWKWKVKVKSLSRVWLLVTPWTAAHQAPLSMGFSRQEYWSGAPLPSPWINPSTRKWDYPSSYESLRAILVTGALAHLPHHLLLEYL